MSVQCGVRLSCVEWAWQWAVHAPDSAAFAGKMGKKGASKKSSLALKDKGILGIKKAIVRKGDNGGNIKKAAAAKTLPANAPLAAQLTQDAARFDGIKDLSLGKLKKRHVMETRKLRQTLQEMTRGKIKLKKKNLEHKRTRKEIGKEVQRMEREHEERQAAEIAYITQRNQAQKAQLAADSMSHEAADAMEQTATFGGGQTAAPQFTFGDMQPDDTDMLASDDEDL